MYVCIYIYIYIYINKYIYIYIYLVQDIKNSFHDIFFSPGDSKSDVRMFAQKSSIPHEMFFGIQRVSNPPIGNKRISTSAHC